MALSDAINIGLIGHPVQHSLSPLIHQYWLDHYGLSGAYGLIDVPAAEILPETLSSLIAKDWRGFNVTVPYKQDIMKLCDNLDAAARAVGAVNLVGITPDGMLSGRNTDAYGFIESLKEASPDFAYSESKALVLGSGGAARAVCYGLKQAGLEHLYIANRTYKKAQDLAENFGGQAVPWEERMGKAAVSSDLIINTTSLGLSGASAFDYDFTVTKPDALVCDIVYKPLLTKFLINAQKEGRSIVTGLGMLLHQARPSFELWTGIAPAVTKELRQKITEAL